MFALRVFEAPPLDSAKSNHDVGFRVQGLGFRLFGFRHSGSGCRAGSYRNMSPVLLSIPILASVIGAKALIGASLN